MFLEYSYITASYIDDNLIGYKRYIIKILKLKFWRIKYGR